MVAGIGAALSGIGSIASAFMGAQESSRANKTNQMINMLNYMMHQQERQDAIAAAKKAEGISYEGTTDAAGNRIHYVPGRGWVTDLSAESAEMQDAQQQEQLMKVVQDLPMVRAAMQRNQGRQLEEGRYADAIKRQMDDVHVDPDRIKYEMLTSANRGMNEDYDNITNSVMKNAARTGNTNVEGLLRGLSKGRGEAMAKTWGEIPAAARSQAEGMESQKKGQLANLYNMFASRASAMPGVSYAPQNVEGSANQFLGGNKAGGANALSNLMSAFGKSGGDLGFVSPDDYMAKALGTTGTALGNFADAATGQREKDLMMKMYLGGRYSPSGGIQL